MPAARQSLLAAALLAATLPAALAQYPGVEGSAQREIALRGQQADYVRNDLLPLAKQFMEGKDYESAYSYYKSAVDTLPSGGDATGDLRQEALDGFRDAAMALANQRISEGRYEDAGMIVDVILSPDYTPDERAALALRRRLNDPKGFIDRGTLTPQQVARIEEVKKLLREADGFYETGRYDLAFKRCEQALNTDRHNIAARKLMEKINDARATYADAAYNETRSDMLAQVTKAWELPLRRFEDGPSAIIEQPALGVRGTQAISDKLELIKIPVINFTDASIYEAIDFLRNRAAALDDTETDPERKGVNIVVKLPPGSPEASYPITLSLSDVPLAAALEYVARAANLKLKIDPYAVVVVPQSESTDVLLTKEYKVPPGFIQALPGGGATGGTAARSLAKDFLEAQGVTFPDGASANYITSTSRLIVNNTRNNLDIVDALVETAAATRPTQVEIEAKFLEVSQNNLNELGLDWLLGSFQLPGGSGTTYGSGGTQGFGQTINSANYPITTPGGLPIGANSNTSGPVTAGNRSGFGPNGYTRAISVNAVDALLATGGIVAGPTPGALALAGVFTNPQFQVVLRALSQKKGVDLVSAPKVTTKSGMRATIEITREFRYPTEFDPPQLSSSFGSQYSPVVPNNPTGWTMKPTGITLEVEPTVAADNYTMDLLLAPRVIEFDGFINYGSPINASVARRDINLVETAAAFVAIPGLGPSFEFEATPNVINQPVFSTREVETQLSIYDGQTVVMGGLMREDVQKVQDKVPILGDIPLAGRLFRTTAEQHIKRNLLMFVTASLLDPAGQPIIEVDDGDFTTSAVDVQALADEIVPGDALSVPLPQ
jgi:general secretion pathway protein D